MSSVRQTAIALLERLNKGLSRPPVEFVFVPHPLWPYKLSGVATTTLNISILDSSFNPPTRAHLALVNSHRPQKWVTDDQTVDYDAKILLLSVKNVDKTLKSGDASYVQRLEMMFALLKDVDSRDVGNSGHANIAIAVIDEPTFVGKSRILLEALHSRLAILLSSPPHHDLELTFLLGIDTLERLFAHRYYTSEADMHASLHRFLSPSPEGDNSRIVCAKRVLASQNLTQAAEPASFSAAKEYEEAGRIEMIDIGDLDSCSSSAIRQQLKSHGVDEGKGFTDTSWKKLVTPDIASYIIEHGLYISA